MNLISRANAEWRALTAAALLGAGVGLGLGAAYMAGGLSQTAKDHARAERLAKAASEGFSETALQAAAARMDLGVLRVARRHDPFTVAGAAERDRQSAIFAARLEQTAGRDGNDLMLRASLPAVEPAAPFRLSGALETSRELECLTQAVYYEARGETAARAEPPELRLRADGELAYRRVVAVMSDAAAAGLSRIGFVTDPRETP